MTEVVENDRIESLRHLIDTNACTAAFLQTLLVIEEYIEMRKQGASEQDLKYKKAEVNANRSHYYHRCQAAGITPHNVDSIGEVIP